MGFRARIFSGVNRLTVISLNRASPEFARQGDHCHFPYRATNLDSSANNPSTTPASVSITILDFLGRFLPALFGAGFGATAAYHLAERREQRQEKTTNHGHAVAAFYLMVARLSSLENFARKFLNDSRNEFEPEVRFHVFYQYCPEERISIRSLAFLGDPDDCQLLADLSLSEARFFNFVDAVKERNRDALAVIAAAHREGIRAGQPFGEASKKMPELELVVIHNRNLFQAANTARIDTIDKLNQMSTMIRRRFPEFKPLSADLIGTQNAEQ